LQNQPHKVIMAQVVQWSPFHRQVLQNATFPVITNFRTMDSYLTPGLAIGSNGWDPWVQQVLHDPQGNWRRLCS